MLYASWARFYADNGYPVGWHKDALDPLVEGVAAAWGQGLLVEYVAPSMAADERFRRWMANFERSAGEVPDGAGERRRPWPVEWWEMRAPS